MLIQLLVGDESGDGHNIRESFLVNLETVTPIVGNISASDIQSIYLDGVKACGIDITEYFEEYEESTMPLWRARQIENVLGIDFGVEYLSDDEDITVFPDDYVEIYIAIFNKNTFGYKMSLNRPLSIPIGGYGLLR